ncbi:MAG TPA: hypothetical protein VK002_03650 [Rubricoccaceae bacterium]|nr:hypothetical protein [Rubricoccaceae bacterium]
MLPIPRLPLLPALVLPLALALTFSGCLALGAGAAAAVGGCALLDRDRDDNVTEAELSAALYDDWDEDDDGRLTRAEFDAGAGARPAFAGVSGSFVAWDADDDGALTEAEFSSGVAESGDTTDWLDAQCDEIGL